MPRLASVKELQCVSCKGHVHHLEQRCSKCGIRLDSQRKDGDTSAPAVGAGQRIKLVLESNVQKIKAAFGRYAGAK